MTAFPIALVGGMMFLVGIQLGKGTVKLRGWKLALCLVTAGHSVVTNTVVDFLTGLAPVYGMRALKRRRTLLCLCAPKEIVCHG